LVILETGFQIPSLSSRWLWINYGQEGCTVTSTYFFSQTYSTNRRYSLLKFCVKRKLIVSCMTYVLPFLFISKMSQAMWIV